MNKMVAIAVSLAMAGGFKAQAQAPCNRAAVDQYRSYMEAGIQASDHADRIFGMQHSTMSLTFRRDAAGDLKVMWDNFSRAAELGSPGGLYRIGDMYERGWYVNQDRQKAAEFYERAAACNQPGAEDRLGAFHEAGVIYPKDYSQASAWYMRAAQHGYPPAYFSLGLFAMEGRTGPRNVSDAEGLMAKACTMTERGTTFWFDHQDYCWSAYALSLHPDIKDPDQLGEAAGQLMVAKADAEFARQWAAQSVRHHNCIFVGANLIRCTTTQ